MQDGWRRGSATKTAARLGQLTGGHTHPTHRPTNHATATLSTQPHARGVPSVRCGGGSGKPWGPWAKPEQRLSCSMHTKQGPHTAQGGNLAAAATRPEQRAQIVHGTINISTQEKWQTGHHAPVVPRHTTQAVYCASHTPPLSASTRQHRPPKMHAPIPEGLNGASSAQRRTTHTPARVSKCPAHPATPLPTVHSYLPLCTALVNSSHHRE